MLKKIREDGWFNLFTQLGGRKDRQQATTYKWGRKLGQQELEAIYESNGMGRRIVDLPAVEMTRRWIEINGDSDGKLLKYLEERCAKHKIRDTLRWARLYGGALCVMGIDDGQDFEQPLNENAVRTLKFLEVYDRHQVTWSDLDLYDDPSEAKFGQPQWYTIQPYGMAAQFRVHESRVLRIDGADLPTSMRLANNGWGDSELQSVYEELRNLGSVSNGSASIIDDFIQTVLSVEGLSNMIAAGHEDLVKKRIELIDMSRSVLNTIILDSQEQYAKQASSVAGLADLWDRFAGLLAAVTGIPQTKLFGRSPAGLNATGENDVRNWYDDLEGEQEDKLLPVLDRLVTVATLAQDCPVQPSDALAVRFVPLWQMDEEQTATVRKVVAEADKIYWEMGALHEREVRRSRWGGDSYSIETEIEGDEPPPPSDSPHQPTMQSGDEPEGEQQ